MEKGISVGLEGIFCLILVMKEEEDYIPKNFVLDCVQKCLRRLLTNE
jgi:hypothetical protein